MLINEQPDNHIKDDYLQMVDMLQFKITNLEEVPLSNEEFLFLRETYDYKYDIVTDILMNHAEKLSEEKFLDLGENLNLLTDTIRRIEGEF